MSIRSLATRAKQAAVVAYDLRRASYTQRRFESLARSGKRTRRLCVVYGNCQAEPVRALLASSPEFAENYEAVRIPAVQDVTAPQLARLQRIIRGTSLIVAQPIKDRYRGLPLGTDEIVALASRECRVIRFPALYYDALYPLQAYVHTEGGPSVPAPVSVYHDLRTLCAAAQGLSTDMAVTWVGEYRPPEDAVRVAAERARASIRSRESATDVRVYDWVVVPPGANPRSFFTVDHPARFVLQRMANAVLDLLGLAGSADADADGGREPLRQFQTPIEQPIIDALGLGCAAVADWIINGERVSAADVARAHLEWYRARPDLVRAGLAEHAERIAAFGLMV
jgi:hypothetical protein